MVIAELTDETGGRVVFERDQTGVLIIRYFGDISLAFSKRVTDFAISEIEGGLETVLQDVGQSVPLFSPVEIMDEVKRIAELYEGRCRCAYLAPRNMFSKHFMLTEAAGFNHGAQIRVFSDEAAACAWLANNG